MGFNSAFKGLKNGTCLDYVLLGYDSV